MPATTLSVDRRPIVASSRRTSLKPCSRHRSAKMVACSSVQPWLPCPRAPGCTLRSMATRRPPGRSTRRTSRSPASMSDQWCTVAIDHTTEAEPSERGMVLGGALDISHLRRPRGEKSRGPQHDGRRVDSGDRRTQSGRVADRDSGATPDVDNAVAGTHAAQPDGKLPRRPCDRRPC